jgi:hypothetical protein
LGSRVGQETWEGPDRTYWGSDRAWGSLEYRRHRIREKRHYVHRMGKNRSEEQVKCLKFTKEYFGVAGNNASTQTDGDRQETSGRGAPKTDKRKTVHDTYVEERVVGKGGGSHVNIHYTNIKRMQRHL